MNRVHDWSGKYLVWPLHNFSDCDLRTTATYRNQKIGQPLVVKRCELPVEEGLKFPLKEEYDRINSQVYDPRFEDTDPKEDDDDPIGAPRVEKQEETKHEAAEERQSDDADES